MIKKREDFIKTVKENYENYMLELTKEVVNISKSFYGIHKRIDDYYGPSINFNGESYIVINNKALTLEEYKSYVFDHDMKDLLS